MIISCHHFSKYSKKPYLCPEKMAKQIKSRLGFFAFSGRNNDKYVYNQENR